MAEPWRPSRRTFLLGTAASAGGLWLRSLLPGAPMGWGTPVALADEPGGFVMSGLGGGGGINCIAVDPAGPRALVGGDNSGPKISTDAGATWAADMTGLSSDGGDLFEVAAEWDPAVPDRVWLASGRRDAFDPAGLFASADAGTTWALATDVPTFDAMSEAGRPRAVGRLIVIGPGGAAAYLGGAAGALWRYDGFDDAGLGGTATQILELSGAVITSIALDPTDPTRLFVSTRTGCCVVGGVDLAEALGAVATPFSGVNAPGRTEELAAVDEDGVPVLYAACWTDGLRRFDATQAADGAWSDVTPPTASTSWCSMDAVREGSATTVVAGNALPAVDPLGGFDPVTGASSHSIFLSLDASDPAPTWTSLCSGVPGEGVLVNESGGPGGDPWWGYLPTTQGGLSDNRLGGLRFTPEQLRIDPGDPQRIFAAGTQGVFLFDRGLSTWYPAMTGLGTTANNTISCDPRDAGRVIVTNIDHVCFVSTDGMRTVRKNENPVSGMANNAFAAAFDTSTVPSPVYLAVGDVTDARGSVVYQNDPASFRDWISLGRPAGSDQRPLGIAVRRLGAQVVVMAAVEASGVYRLAISTKPKGPLKKWVKANAVALKATQPSGAAPMAWEHDEMVYLFDHASGIWVSRNAGVSWQKIWAIRDNAAFEGFIAPDPADRTGGTLYVSLGRSAQSPGVWKLTGCQTPKATVENHKIHLRAITGPTGLPFVAPGPIVVRSGGQLWVVENQGPDLCHSLDGGATWTSLGDDVFTAGAKRVADMDVGVDGAVYLALRGPGVLIRPAP